MKDLVSIHFKSRNEFRSWLLKNHDKSPGFWMIFFKKHTKKENIPYADAVEEAICFGWIDSLVKKIDEESYVRKFTPRINTKIWSEINRIRALNMIREGKMTETGLFKFNSYLKTENTNRQKEKPDISIGDSEIPEFIIGAFAQNEPALLHFNNLAPSHKRNYILWITTAKKKATIQKRLKESINLLIKNKKLGLK